MDVKSMRAKAKQRLKGYCRVCPICNGVACAGEVPGVGGVGSGSSFMANIDALANIRFNMRTIHQVKSVETSIQLFGREIGMPILAAPMTGVSYNFGGDMGEDEFADTMIRGAIAAGTLGMTGDGADPAMFDGGLAAIAASGGAGIPVIKPRAQEEIIRLIKKAEAAGVAAVGIDIDGAGLVTMAMKGQPVGPKTSQELREVIESTALPFILKGIMTPDEAEMAVDVGAAAVVVSNHGGRVLDCTPGAAEVLGRIAAAVKGRVVVLADGGVRSGADVLKYLALGADAVLVGRPLVIGAFGAAAAGVAGLLNAMKGELVQAMLLTGTVDVKDVSPRILYDDCRR
jgi:isopentenyl diphosphate isomerase/L-lactate dehydrogenase-like FMN-dependent dehydrogenase